MWKGGEPRMNLKKQIGAVVLAVALAPAYVIAQDMEFNGTIVSKEEKSIKVKTKDGEKMLAVGKSTKGLENSKDEAKATIKYTEQHSQLRASEINPRELNLRLWINKKAGFKRPAFCLTYDCLLPRSNSRSG